MSLGLRIWVGLQGLFLLFWCLVVVRFDIAVVTEPARFDPIHLLFLTPFNAVVVAVVWSLGLRLACARDEKGGAIVIADGALTRVRPPTSRPVVIALGVSLLFSGVLFASLQLGSDGHPSRWGVVAVFTMLGVVAAWVHHRASAKAGSGAHDIVIDDVAHTLAAVRKGVAPSQQTLHWSAIEAINVGEDATPFEDRPGWRYLVTVTRKDAWNVIQLGRWPSAASARRFRDWLARRLKMGALEY